MLNKHFLLWGISALVLLLACQNNYSGGQQKKQPVPETNDPVQERIQITSPKTGWAYYRNRTVHLAMNTRSENIEWSSAEDGFLGAGNNLFVNMNTGVKNIKAKYNGMVYSVKIEVKQDLIAPLEERRFVISAPETAAPLLPGHYFPAIISFEGMAALLQYRYDTVEPAQNVNKPQTSMTERNGRPEIKKDFHVEYPENMQMKRQNTLHSRSIQQARAAAQSYKTGDKRTFVVLDTTNQYSTPHKVQATLSFIEDKYTIWLPDGVSVNMGAINQCRQKLNTVIIPRLSSIWGDWSDVDGDGRIAILFSKTINDEEVCLGYFNALDIFKANDEEDDSNINKMDIIYAGLPDTQVNTSAYNYNTISATLAHELSHLFTYSQKTYKKIQAGILMNREELFLDEGISHLIENLCGFGVSGGNIAILSKYFENTQDYSFYLPNRLGQADSNGLRGAICLFLSWMFWKQGGITIDASNPGKIYDAGGIGFLRRLMEDNFTGLATLNSVLGKPLDQVYADFVYDMNRQRAEGSLYNYKEDPHSKEPIEFYNNMGNFTYQNKIYSLDIKTPVEANQIINTIPWSFFLIPPVQIEDESLAKISSTYTMGKLFLSVVKAP